MTLRSRILNAPVPTRDIEVAEWGETIRLRPLSIRTRIDLLDVLYANEEAVRLYREDQALPPAKQQGLPKVDPLDQSILHLIWTMLDPKTDKPIFTMADYAQVIDLPQATLNNLYSQLLSLEARAGIADQKKSSD